MDPRLLRTIFDRLPAMIAYWDADARNVVANAAYVEWFGFHPDEMPGVHISEVLGPEVYAKNLPFITAALAGEEQLFDRTLVDQAGRTRHTQASYVPDVVDGRVLGFYVLVTDVTPRVEAQRAMDEAQALAHLGSWSLLVATGEVQWSDELYRIVGVDPDATQLDVDTLSRLVHPEDLQRVMGNIEDATRTGSPYTIAYRVVRPDGEVRDVLSQGRPVLDADGEVVRLSGTLQDVTEANRTSRELARINAELVRANEVNADVIAMLGHDIRTPLTATAGFLQLLGDEWDRFTDERRRDLVARARASTTRLAAMVERILALATVDSGTVATVPSDVDLGQAVSGVLADLGWAERVRLHDDTDDTDDARARVDTVHLTQILTNLVGNAFRYGAEPVTVGLSAAGDHLVVSVSDAGAGVPAERVGQLFSRFARTGSRQDEARGTGFGLYVSAELARANGGSLRYEPPRGDAPHRFVLCLPRAG